MEMNVRTKQIAIAILASLYFTNLCHDYDPFITIAELINTELNGDYKPLSPFEKDLMMLAEDFFDANWHGIPKVGKIPTAEARPILERTAIAILNGHPVDQDAVRAPFATTP